MKALHLFFSATVAATAFLTGCASTGSMATGSDAKYLNATRGSATAQISSAQAEQIARQQDLTSREIDLEEKKRRQTTNAVHDTAGAARDAVVTLRGIADLVR